MKIKAVDSYRYWEVREEKAEYMDREQVKKRQKEQDERRARKNGKYANLQRQ